MRTFVRTCTNLGWRSNWASTEGNLLSMLTSKIRQNKIREIKFSTSFSTDACLKKVRNLRTYVPYRTHDQPSNKSLIDIIICPPFWKSFFWRNVEFLFYRNPNSYFSFLFILARDTVTAPHFFGLESAIGPKIWIIPKQNQES